MSTLAELDRRMIQMARQDVEMALNLPRASVGDQRRALQNALLILRTLEACNAP